MIEEHDIVMFTRELSKLKLEYLESTNATLKECIQYDILFLEDVLNNSLH
ncbi:hypothetical protein [Alkalicoccobacillus porphyridii]|nr:hypothetical protein [Alkalicoccobacillus porphyridii]